MRITDENFIEIVLRPAKPTLVVFWQPKCKFCEVLFEGLEKSVLANVARATPFVNVRGVNAKACSKTAARYRVDGYPAFLLFRNGEVVDRKAGTASFENIVGWLKGKLT